jgi:hypothetical protein
LFDLEIDPDQLHPLDDEDLELRMLRLMARMMHETDAPRSQFVRLGIPYDTEPTRADVLVAQQAARAAAVAEPLPSAEQLPAAELLATPLLELLELPGVRPVAERHFPHLVSTELITVPPGMSVLDMAAYSAMTAQQLIDFSTDLAAISVPSARKSPAAARLE